MDTETKPLWATTREAMGRVWTIGLYADDLHMRGNETSAGRVWHMKQNIAINAASPCDGRDESLLHEIVHVADDSLGLALDERATTEIASVLYALLRGFGLWKEFPWPDSKRR